MTLVDFSEDEMLNDVSAIRQNHSDTLSNFDHIRLCIGLAKSAMAEARYEAAQSSLDDAVFWLNESEAEASQ